MVLALAFLHSTAAEFANHRHWPRTGAEIAAYNHHFPPSGLLHPPTEFLVVHTRAPSFEKIYPVWWGREVIQVLWTSPHRRSWIALAAVKTSWNKLILLRL